MVINQLYKKYFQKSKILLYPLLGIERGNIAPLEVYLSIEGKYTPQDQKLICVYDPTSDENYLELKKERLEKHSLLSEQFVDKNGHEVFVFDFSKYASTWNLLLDGKYSQIPIKEKNIILNFFEKNSGNYIYIHSYLFPNKWHERYAEILDVPVDLIKEVNELIDKPDFEKETFHYKVEHSKAVEAKVAIEEKRIIQISQSCPRCNGQGYIPKYSHIENGRCFKCGGAKQISIRRVA
jgi:hypothetical protein